MDSELHDLIEFLRFPSISTDPAFKQSVSECAGWLKKKLIAIGLQAQMYPTAGHPIVVARNKHVAGRRTVLIYGHYDVQPVDPVELWTHDPFEPHIENDIITARGATDNKGQILAHIQGVAQAIAESELPVNLIFLIEGEEEIGSPHLGPFLEQHAEELQCDVVAISDTGMIGRGVPTFTYALRGILCVEVRLNGPAMDLHSGIYGGTVANPITSLARLIATLHDEEGRILIPGFYDDVLPVASWEREKWKKLSHDQELVMLTGVPELFGETGFTPTERIWARPTAELNGIGGGYQGEGSKTVIPKEAFAKLTFRLVPDQKPERILELVRGHFQKHCGSGVRVEVVEGHSGLPYLMDPNSKDGKAAQQALVETFGGEVALIREGGSIPIVQTFRDVLKVDTLLLGLALPDCRAHSPNENFPLENYYAGMRLNRNLLRALA